MVFIVTWRSFIFITIANAICATIFRMPCKRTAEFSVAENDKKLPGFELAEFNGVNDFGCGMECVANAKCRSYNLYRNGKKCVLNKKALVDENADLVAAPGWTYRSTDYSIPPVGPVCAMLQPCNPGTLCSDTCEAPYYYCQDIDECASQPCQNGGQCTNRSNKFTCSCLTGFMGDRCEININECSSNPCMNGGTCIDHVNRYSCTCNNGYTGTRCEIRVDPCDSDPCPFGHSCTSRLYSYYCTS